MEQIKFKLDTFEGPLDLLLHLIQKNKVNIYDIPISLVTEQYIEYIQSMQEMDLDVSSEFLVLAAQLLYIKSKMLLPKHHEEEEEEDPREELAKRLVEYRNFKAVSLYLRQFEEIGNHIFCKPPEYIERRVIDRSFKELTMENLLNALSNLHKKAQSMNHHSKDAFQEIVWRPRVSVFSKVKDILRKIKNFKKISFKDLFRSMESRSEAVAGFLAVLELLKLNRLKLSTDKGEVIIQGNKQGAKDGD